MNLDTNAILSLSPAEKLQLVELIWDNLAEIKELPVPDWVIAEASRRRDELKANPHSGKSHDEVWKSINGRST